LVVDKTAENQNFNVM
jgi:hypothetical protein